MGGVPLVAVEQAIEAGHDELHDMADWLGVDPDVLADQLAEMREQRLIFRYRDGSGVSRHGIAKQRRAA
jgi:hypothetical protein